MLDNRTEDSYMKDLETTVKEISLNSIFDKFKKDIEAEAKKIGITPEEYWDKAWRDASEHQNKL